LLRGALLDLVVLAPARNGLAQTRWAALEVAPRHVKLAHDGSAITTGAFSNLPTRPFVSVSDPRYRDATYGNRGLALRLFQALRPVWVDTHAAEKEG
jgi:hypothetical protein